MTVRSHRGPYRVLYKKDVFSDMASAGRDRTHFVVDARVASLYRRPMRDVLRRKSLLKIRALESNKSLEKFPRYVEHLLKRGVRRGHVLVAVGGGITQDIVSFLATTLFRGVDWIFYPTTLLAQADSCIGSKSSINAAGGKNVLGTYTPPKRIVLSARFLDTLAGVDKRSGIGEMLKVHAIQSPASFDRIAKDYPSLLENRALMVRYIRRSLIIKKRLVEKDEFDRGPRLVMNYGHSFGHAIESATNFSIPHGIAVCLGMDMANYVSFRLHRTARHHYRRMHPVLFRNYAGFAGVAVPFSSFWSALSRDKKNVDSGLRLILPDKRARVSLQRCARDNRLKNICQAYFSQERRP